jgi:DNA polymerase III subunit delta'
MAFSEILGNKTAQSTLSRMLEHKTLPHALLFCGPKGVGKGTHALRLAEALLGSSDKLIHGNHPDLHPLHPEGKGGMHPIENMRNLIKEAAYPPFEAPVKVFILYDAHQMLPASSNALLKTLEEPIAHTYFILITSQRESLLPTIVSRSRIIPFFPIPDKEIEQFAVEHWHKEAKEAKRIAFLSHGSFAKAFKLAHKPKDDIRALMYALVNLSLPQEYARLLSLCDECEKIVTPSEEAGEERASDQIDDLLEEIFAWYRDLYLLKSSIASEYLYHLDAAQQLHKAAYKAPPPLEEVLKGILTMRAALQRHVKLRVALEHFFL